MAEAFDCTKYTALVIEDNEFVRQMVKKYLSDFGFRDIYEAADGAEGIKMLDKNPDIVICDINMTPLNGFDFVKHVRALPPPANKMPIIFLTGDGHVEQVQGAINLSVDAYLLKPVTADKLKNRVVALMTRKTGA